MKRVSKQGLTLLETLVVCLIFSIILGVLGELLQWGLRAHRKGEAARKATTLGREIINHLTSEIATGVSLEPYSPDLLNGVSRDFQSAVLWPDCFSGDTVSFSSPFWARERVTSTLASGQTIPVDRVHNRLIFSRPGKKPGPNFNSADYAQFVYVEYLVVPADAAGKGQNRLYRRLYQVAKPPVPDPVGITLAGFTRTILPAFFIADPTDPLGNVNMLNTGLSAPEKLEQGVVYELPHDNDQISFTIDHSQYVPNNGLTPPKVAAYDPSLFTVSVTINIDNQGSFLATQTLSEQARVKTGE